MPAEAKSLWRQKLREALLGKPEDVRKVGGREFVQVANALKHLGDKDVTGLVVAWTAGGKGLPSCGPEELAWLAEALAGAGDAAKAAMAKLSEHVAAKYLADAAAARAVPCGCWKTLATKLANALPAETKGVWVARLRAAFAEGDQGLAALKSKDDLDGILQALEALGDRQAGTVAALLAESSRAWQSWRLEDIGWLAQRLAQAGEAGPGKAGLARLSEHLQATYASSPSVIRSIPCQRWRDLAGHVAKAMPAERRADWAARLRAAFLEDAGGRTALQDRPSAEALTRALESLGDKAPHSVAACVVEQTGAWQSWPSGELSWLAGGLSALDPAGKAGRQKLAEHILTDRLGDRKTICAVGCDQWRQLAAALAADLPEDARSRWASALRNAMVGDPAGHASLDAQALGALADALRALGDKRAPLVPASFVAEGGSWRAWSIAELARLAGLLGSLGDEGAEARKLLAEHVQAKHLGTVTATRAVSCRDWKELTGRFAKCLTPDARAAWAAKLSDAFIQDKQVLAKLKMEEIRDLTDALRSLDPGRASAALAAWMTRR